MDKFGIFNLLNTFLKNNLDASQPKNTDQIVVKSDNSEKPEETKTSNSPLQSKMLATMTSHDEWVKRVRKNTRT